MRATPIRTNQSKQLAPKSLRPVVLAPLAVLLALAGCAEQTAAPVETTAALDAPRYGAAKVDTTGMADAVMDAAGDAMPKATADTMMAELMSEASQIDSPTPDMRAYGRCVGISDYMTAHSTAKDRGDWAKDSRKLEASAERRSQARPSSAKPPHAHRTSSLPPRTTPSSPASARPTRPRASSPR